MASFPSPPHHVNQPNSKRRGISSYLLFPSTSTDQVRKLFPISATKNRSNLFRPSLSRLVPSPGRTLRFHQTLHATHMTIRFHPVTLSRGAHERHTLDERFQCSANAGTPIGSMIQRYWGELTCKSLAQRGQQNDYPREVIRGRLVSTLWVPLLTGDFHHLSPK